MEIIKFDVIDSTQTYAKKLALEGEKEKIICAAVQTAGRGRIGNEWQSLNGGLWFSFITDVSDFEQEKINFFTLLLGITVHQVCSNLYKTEIKLKWPNDLLLNNKKICGIVCEKIGDKIISGIGINTNLNTNELIDCATSFIKETGVETDNIELMKNIVDTFYNNLIKFNKNELIEAYRNNMVYINEKRFIKTIKKEAVIKGIDENGALIIEEDNVERKITFGEIM